MKELNWIYTLKDEVLDFLEHQKSKKVKGYYKYSYSGDLYDDSIHWNVGSSVFALKIYYTLGVSKNREIEEVANYIKSFYHKDSQIYDDFIFKKGFARNLLSSIKHKNFANLFNEQYKRAETRQSYSALMLYDELPKKINIDIPKDENEIDTYLSNLNWYEPWGAGSHFSHLMFFYRLAKKVNLITDEEFESLTRYAINWIDKLRHPDDGGWYKGKQSDRFIVNGAMKIITGLIAVDKVTFDYAKELVDTCLKATNDEHACDNFNIILVLNYASKLLGRDYRQNEIEKFALDRLVKYKAHYKKEEGGFSFFPFNANERYYGAKITRGLNEADIHGTVLFLWGIAIVSQILGIDNELGFKEFRT
ncbi:hypothetical protein [Hydrogenimonas thermophila]|uniref:Lanthionine synthetase C-like protein n=1 Tax=Hydrogenimonas thermophila TaxID=223786 RepID=A0A1I5L985_9BACT|nr:hypothetical protein [Hydrogenimonas thermophila]SFO93778.1 hypothetical protein SAMN05216234_102101 [Hydrogenimonas thermophila]